MLPRPHQVSLHEVFFLKYLCFLLSFLIPLLELLNALEILPIFLDLYFLFLYFQLIFLYSAEQESEIFSLEIETIGVHYYTVLQDCHARVTFLLCSFTMQ